MNRNWLLMLVLGTVILYWFADALASDFIQLDDDYYILLNPNVRNGLTAAGVGWALTTYDYFYWQPLTWISHMIDCELYGLRPAGHHFTNIVLHAINAGLVFWVLLRLTGIEWASLVAAAFFAWHPLRVESVMWVAERKDLLSSLFWFVSILTYERYARTREKRWYWWTVGAMMLGVASKPTVVTLPFALLLLDYWPLRREEGLGVLLKEKIPLFVMSVACGALTFLGQREFGAVVTLEGLPLVVRLTNAVTSYLRYLSKTVWPDPLTVYYTYDLNIQWGLVAAAVLLVAAGTAAGLWQWKKRPYLLIGWLYFLGTLVPTLGLIQVGTQAYADRFTYIPTLGLMLAAVPLLGSLKDPLQKGALLIPLVMAAVSFHQIGYWKDSVVLFKHTIDVTKHNPKMLNNLGYALLILGRPAEAVPYLEESVKQDQKYERARMNLGLAHWRLSRYDVAEKVYRDALKVFVCSGEAHVTLGLVLLEQKQNEKAEAEFEAALRCDVRPDLAADAHTNLGVAAASRKEFPKAEQHFRTALQLKPDLGKAHYNLVMVLMDLGREKEAMQQLTWGIAITKGDQALRNLQKQMQGR